MFWVIIIYIDFNFFFIEIDDIYDISNKECFFTTLFQQQLDPLSREDPAWVYPARASSPVKEFRIYHRGGQPLTWIHSRFSVVERGNSGKHLKAFETGVVADAHAREREKRVERQLITNVRDLSGRGGGEEDKEGDKKETRADTCNRSHSRCLRKSWHCRFYCCRSTVSAVVSTVLTVSVFWVVKNLPFPSPRFLQIQPPWKSWLCSRLECFVSFVYLFYNKNVVKFQIVCALFCGNGMMINGFSRFSFWIIFWEFVETDGLDYNI